MSPAMNFTKYVKDNFIMSLPKAINRKKVGRFCFAHYGKEYCLWQMKIWKSWSMTSMLRSGN
jgi:hypothetical protein